MSKLENYTGSVTLISGITQKNGGSFPLVEANAVLVGSDDLRLDEVLDQKQRYTYDQTLAAAAVWEINHNLNRYPSVTVVDTGGSSVVGEIDYVDTNNLTITFSAATTGVAYLT